MIRSVEWGGVRRKIFIFKFFLMALLASLNLVLLLALSILLDTYI